MKIRFAFLIFYVRHVLCEDYLMMLNSSNDCGRTSSGSFYKTSSSDDLLLYNQIVFYWDALATRNFTVAPKDFRIFNRIVCPGVSVRPAGRYVRRFLSDGAVYFWLLHVQASIECPESRRQPAYEDFHLRLVQWIDRSEAGAQRAEADDTYDRGDSFHLPSHKEPENLTLSCASPQRSVTLQGRLRLLHVSWQIYPGLFSTPPTENVTGSFHTNTSTPTQILTGLVDLPPELKLRVQITSRLHFDGEFSRSRRRDLCEFYGFWCDGTLTDDLAKPPRHRRHRRWSDSGDEANGACIRPSMRCDGLPDCWLDDSDNSPDEVGCSSSIPVDPDDLLSPFAHFNGSLPTASSSSSGRGQSWTAKLPWMVVAFVPVVLLCALVRICSQRRQLDFATDDDLNGIDGVPNQEVRLQRPRSLPAFDNVGVGGKKVTPLGRNCLASALRRSRSSEDILNEKPVDDIALKPLNTTTPPTIAPTSYLLPTDNVLLRITKDNSEIKMRHQPPTFVEEEDVVGTASPTRRNRGSAVNRMIMSCWSGDISVSSSSCDSPTVGRLSVCEGVVEQSCDVCRQMRASAMIKVDSLDETKRANPTTNESHSSTSGISTPSTTSTSGLLPPSTPPPTYNTETTPAEVRVICSDMTPRGEPMENKLIPSEDPLLSSTTSSSSGRHSHRNS